MTRGRATDSVPRVPPHAHLVVQQVRNGRGIVARRAFAPGELICPLKGRIISATALWRMWGRDPRAAANCIRYDAEHYLDPRGHIGAYANHSCRPNTALFREGKRLVLRAIRRIRAWEELTHDYATLLGADDIWTMRCNCGERNCRGVVRRVDRLPPAVLRRYLRLGAVPDYVLATCDRL